MRGEDNKQEAMFSYVSPEKRVPTDHPLRPIRAMVDGILKEMSPQFAKRYADVGRPSIAPERLLRVLLLQIFYSVRSERLLMEQLRYNLLFRWFVGMEMDEEVWNHAVFSKNRERLLNEEIAEAFFQRVLAQAQPYLSDEHFTVDGTLIEAWAMSDKLPDKLQAKITSEALLTDQNYIQTIEFMDHPSPRFWGITLPPEDWNPVARLCPRTSERDDP